MAIIPSAKYPSQVASDPTNYPQGRARNVTVSGDGTGTPWEADLVNDIFGFQQAILTAASITPSGNSETALVSQYLSGLQALFAPISNHIVVMGYLNVTGGGISDSTTNGTTGEVVTGANKTIAGLEAGDIVHVHSGPWRLIQDSALSPGGEIWIKAISDLGGGSETIVDLPATILYDELAAYATVSQQATVQADGDFAIVAWIKSGNGAVAMNAACMNEGQWGTYTVIRP